MNPVSRFLNFDKDKGADDALTPEELKKQRIEWHRRHVRTGPTKIRYISTGQQRRQADRDRASMSRKVNRRHRRAFLKQQRMIAVLRGQLQILGVVPFATDYRPTHTQRLAAGQWVMERFAPRNEEGDLILHDQAFEEAVGAALEAYNRATKVAA